MFAETQIEDATIEKYEKVFGDILGQWPLLGTLG